MCEILGMNCAEKTDFSFSFSGFRQRGGKTDKHRDGFGIAFYEGSGLRCFIDTLPAATSPLAEMIAKSEYKYSIKTLNMISHVRYATRGKAGSLANVHPFQREMWGMHFIFAHNGDIPKFSVSKKEKEGQGQEEEEEQEEEVRGGCNMNISDRDSDSNINETLIGNKKNNNHYPYNFNCPLLGKTTLDDIIYTPVGETDSEAMFCAILNALKAEFKSPPPLSIFHKKLQEFCNEIVSGEEEECICNFLMGCGQYTLFAFSWPGTRPGSSVWNGLHYTLRQPPFTTAELVDIMDYKIDFSTVTTDRDRVAVIATRPLTKDETWIEFEKGELIMFDRGRPYSC